MTTCVIITGWDTSTRIPAALINAASDPSCGYGGKLICGCDLCVNGWVATFPESPPGTFSVSYLNARELKPAETYVLTFDTLTGAQNWLQHAAPALSGKTVYRFDPAI